jgi:4-hydroxy-3-methylbut-2-enyl diphosphate reductase
VHHAHRCVAALVADGFHPVIIGQKGHVEVNGLTEDLEEFDIVLTEEEVGRLPERPRFGVVAQTTQPIERARRLVVLIETRFPHSQVRFVDTICQPTKQRQSAAVELARECDVVVVIGGANSNNTRELVETCRRHCSRAHHIQRADDLQSVWFQADDTVGVTAGTSTPDSIIEEARAWLEGFARFQAQLAEHMKAPVKHRD